MMESISGKGMLRFFYICYRIAGAIPGMAATTTRRLYREPMRNPASQRASMPCRTTASLKNISLHTVPPFFYMLVMSTKTNSGRLVEEWGTVKAEVLTRFNIDFYKQVSVHRRILFCRERPLQLKCVLDSGTD